MALRYNDQTGEFESDGNTARGGGGLRYNDETGEFEREGSSASRRRRNPAGGTRRGPPRPMRTTPLPDMQAIRRIQTAARIREERRRKVFLRLVGCMLLIDVLVLVFGGGGDVLVSTAGVFFFLWLAYRLVTGAIWPWLVLAGLVFASCLSK